jgi:hypothetical protein
MSIGLGDIDKKRRASLRTEQPATAPAGPRTWTSRTARPWSASGLNIKSSPNRRRSTSDGEAVMNEDWLNLDVAPLFWIDPNQNSHLLTLQLKLLAIEEALTTRFAGPLEFVARRLGIKSRLEDQF